MKRLFLILIPLLLISAFVHAQDQNEILNLRMEVRADYMQEYQHADKIDPNSGFMGKYLNIRMDGTIAEGLSYSYRQRLNRPNKNASFFDSTDWITMTYSFGNWGLSAGKQVVAIGGYEYDGAPIDLYFCSEYWNNISCYQFGVSASYAPGGKNDTFTFQLCESPFRKNVLNVNGKEMFAYNLMWTGNHGFFSSLYSVNMIEYMPGRFINYIALGNRFSVGDFVLELDLMNRAAAIKDFPGKDFSVMSELLWHATDRLDIFAKMTYDVNKAVSGGDLCVAPGTDIVRVGGGLEFYPLKKTRDLRLHLNCCYTDGIATSGVLRPFQTIWDCGVTWRMNLLKFKR